MAGQITSLRFQKGNQERVNVYIDGEYAFALPAVEAAQLRRGNFLTDAEIERLRQVDIAAKGYDRSVRFLGVRPRSELEVRQNLQRYRPRNSEGLDEAQIEQVVERLRLQGYVDDEAFARYWIDQRNRFKPMAPQALRYELRRKGVDSRIIDAVVADETDADTAALEVARRQAQRWLHLGEAEFQKKLTGVLQRRGFRWDTIREVIQQVWQEQQADEENPD